MWLVVRVVLAVAAFATQGGADDRAALLAFKARGADQNGYLTSWCEEPCEAPCESGWNDFTIGWYGLKCNKQGGRVAILFVGSTGLTGSIEPLAALTQLRELWLQNTEVTGSVEPVAALTQLEQLCLYDTGVTGSVEPLASLTQLRELWLQNTEVMGSV
eukprot:COSAG02_NODE_25555_length_655_cov_0.998201_1_plen_158_part_10